MSLGGSLQLCCETPVPQAHAQAGGLPWMPCRIQASQDPKCYPRALSPGAACSHSLRLMEKLLHSSLLWPGRVDLH